MKKITLFAAASVLMLFGLNAQNNRTVGTAQSLPFAQDIPAQRTCGTMENITAADMEALEKSLKPHIQAYIESQNLGNNAKKAVYNIPTVVHIIHNSNEAVGSGRNIPYQRVTEQMQILNDDFRRTNSDAVNTPSYFQGVAADCEINFCLVTRYPSGHPMAGQTLPEVGVDRVSTTQISGISNTSSGYSMGQIDGTIKPATSWNPNEVMNIWVCQLQSGLLGYATFPNSGPADRDGTVMGYQYFGNTTAAPYNLGRTTTHEVGHWLGLYHIWGDDNGACSGSDQCADTPNQANSTGGCPSGVRTDGCTGAPNGIMYQNYMDYSNDACMNIFTQDQKARMQSTMASQPRRSTLNGFSATLCAATGLTADFNESATTITAGQTITFTDNSSGPNPINMWNWDFDVTNLGGVSPATANTQGAHVVTYNTPGVYTVSLQVGDGTSTDTRTKNSHITVLSVGSQICDSTLANWDINNTTHTNATGAYAWNGGNGYILGQNTYGDNGWADKVTYTGSGTYLTDVIYYFGVASGSSTTNLKVWGEATNIPNNANIMAQQTFTNTTFNTGGQPTIWTIPSAPILNGNFYVGFDHNTLTSGDTVALMSAPTGTNSVFANETTGWVDLATYGLDHGAAIIPVVCNNTSTGEKEILGEIKDVTVFPNPTNGTINVALPSKVVSSVEVYNVVGKLVSSTTPLSTQLITVNFSDQPAGIYIVNVKTGNSVITKKVMLTK